MGNTARGSAGRGRLQRAQSADSTNPARPCGMRLWDLPGARRFVDCTCDHLRGGSSVVVRFPGMVPEGFNTAVGARLGNALEVGRLSVTASPLHDLARRYAEHPSHIGRLPDLCDDPGFRGQLVRPEGLDATTWPAWRHFLSSYVAASRSRPPAWSQPVPGSARWLSPRRATAGRRRTCEPRLGRRAR